MGTKPASSRAAQKSGNRPAEGDYIAEGEAAVGAVEVKLLGLPSDTLRYVPVDVESGGTNT